jgi:hypothetical protein
VSHIPKDNTIGVNLDNLECFLRNLDKVHYLAEIVINEPHLEIKKPLVSDFLYLRYIYPNVIEFDLEGINRMILNEMWKTNSDIQEEKVEGKYYLKVSNIKQSCYSDLDILIEQIITIGDILVKEYL